MVSQYEADLQGEADLGEADLGEIDEDTDIELVKRMDKITAPKEENSADCKLEDLRYDSGWAWIVLIGSFYGCFITNWGVVNYGLFFVEIQSLTNCSATQAAWIGTANFVTLNFVYPFADLLCRRYSTRVIVMLGGVLMSVGRATAAYCSSVGMFTLTLGFIDGIGGGMTFGTSIVFLRQYFKRRIGLVSGIVSTNYGVALLISLQVTNKCLNEYGLNGTLLIQAGVAMHCCLAGAVMFPRENNDKLLTEKRPISNRPTEKRQISKRTTKYCKIVTFLLRIVPRDPVEVLLIFGYSFSTLCHISVAKYIPPLSRDLNISKSQIAWIMMIAGIPDIVARFLTGLVSDFKFIKRSVKVYRVWAFCMLAMSVCYCLLPHVQSYEGVFINTLCLTVAGGACTGMAPITALEQMGAARFGRTFTSMMFGLALFSLTDVFIVANLRDLTGSYHTSLYFLSSVALLGALLTFAQQFGVKWRKRKQRID